MCLGSVYYVAPDLQRYTQSEDVTACTLQSAPVRGPVPISSAVRAHCEAAPGASRAHKI